MSFLSFIKIFTFTAFFVEFWNLNVFVWIFTVKFQKLSCWFRLLGSFFGTRWNRSELRDYRSMASSEVSKKGNRGWENFHCLPWTGEQHVGSTSIAQNLNIPVEKVTFFPFVLVFGSSLVVTKDEDFEPYCCWDVVKLGQTLCFRQRAMARLCCSSRDSPLFVAFESNQC